MQRAMYAIIMTVQYLHQGPSSIFIDSEVRLLSKTCDKGVSAAAALDKWWSDSRDERRRVKKAAESLRSENVRHTCAWAGIFSMFHPLVREPEAEPPRTQHAISKSANLVIVPVTVQPTQSNSICYRAYVRTEYLSHQFLKDITTVS